jgi:hypothetical protein
MTIESRTDNEITFAAGEAAEHVPLYLGAILSADRSTVYWVNNTRPLP